MCAVLPDDITLTVDGKDTYEEVKKSGRYRQVSPRENMWNTVKIIAFVDVVSCLLLRRSHPVCCVVAGSVREPRECQPQIWSAGCCWWPKHTTATLWVQLWSLFGAFGAEHTPWFHPFLPSQDSSDYQQHTDNFGKVGTRHISEYFWPFRFAFSDKCRSSLCWYQTLSLLTNSCVCLKSN